MTTATVQTRSASLKDSGTSRFHHAKVEIETQTSARDSLPVTISASSQLTEVWMGRWLLYQSMDGRVLRVWSSADVATWAGALAEVYPCLDRGREVVGSTVKPYPLGPKGVVHTARLFSPLELS